MEPAEVRVEAACSDASTVIEGSFERLVPAIDGVDMQFTADALAFGVIGSFMGDAKSRRARWVNAGSIGHQQSVDVENRPKSLLGRLSGDGGQDRAEGGPTAVHRDKGRSEFL